MLQIVSLEFPEVHLCVKRNFNALLKRDLTFCFHGKLVFTIVVPRRVNVLAEVKPKIRMTISE